MKVLFFFLFIFHALVGQKLTYTQTHVRCYNFYVKKNIKLAQPTRVRGIERKRVKYEEQEKKKETEFLFFKTPAAAARQLIAFD